MTKPYKIVADENMPGVEKLFSDIADITLINGREISESHLFKADALLCRSITQINSKLLTDTNVRFVGTATIGIDHLDTHWLTQNGISWSNAAGCNAPAVGQYVLSAIAFWCIKNERLMKNVTVGIIGAGNVGSTLARYLDFYNISYQLCDPLLQEQGDPRELVEFQSTLECDVISLHVPISTSGAHPTHHLFSKSVLAKLNKSQLLINASRGAVIDNQALNEYLTSSNTASCILDVYENEPDILPSLVKNCLLTTPHIAGHTLEGKLRGTWRVYKAFCKAFSLSISKTEEMLYPVNNLIGLKKELSLEEMILAIYNISLDSKSLKELHDNELKAQFDKLRKNATKLSNGTIRRDYTGWEVVNNGSKHKLPT